MKSIVNPFVKTVGANLLPPFYEWTSASLNGITPTIEKPYKAGISTTATNQYLGTNGINVLPSTQYTLSALLLIGKIYINEYDVSGTMVRQTTITSLPHTFTTSPTTVVFAVFLGNSDQTGTYSMEEPMLNIGDQPLPFSPQDIKYVGYDVTLASSVDGTVYDELTELDGKMVKTKRIKEMVLDGSLGWSFFED